LLAIFASGAAGFCDSFLFSHALSQFSPHTAYRGIRSTLTHHAGIVRESAPLALRNFLPQIRQPHIGAVALNQILFSVLARTPAFCARQAHNVAGIVAKMD
jgi:hypothetical protein